MDTLEIGSFSRAQVKAVRKKIFTFQGAPTDVDMVDAALDNIMSVADLNSDGNISNCKEAGWKLMIEQMFRGSEDRPSEEVDQLFSVLRSSSIRSCVQQMSGQREKQNGMLRG